MAFGMDQRAESAQAIGPRRALRNGYGGGEGARLGDLRNGDNVLPGIAAAKCRFFGHHDRISWLESRGQSTSCPERAAAADNFSIRTQNEDAFLVGKGSCPTCPREIPRGAFSARVSNRIGVVHLP